MRKSVLIATVSASAGLLLGGVGLASAHEAEGGRHEPDPAVVADDTSTTSTQATVDDHGVDDPAGHDLGEDEASTTTTVADPATDPLPPTTAPVREDDHGVDVPGAHDVGDDHGVDGADHDADDDHGGATEAGDDHRGRGRGDDDAATPTTVEDRSGRDGSGSGRDGSGSGRDGSGSGSDSSGHGSGHGSGDDSGRD